MIYRGYEIELNVFGNYAIHSYGSHPRVKEMFHTEEEAMAHVDKLLREARKQD